LGSGLVSGESGQHGGTKTAWTLHYPLLRYCHTLEQIRGRDPRLGREPLTYHLVPLENWQFSKARL
jgi:hypothetical protein